MSWREGVSSGIRRHSKTSPTHPSLNERSHAVHTYSDGHLRHACRNQVSRRSAGRGSEVSSLVPPPLSCVLVSPSPPPPVYPLLDCPAVSLSAREMDRISIFLFVVRLMSPLSKPSLSTRACFKRFPLEAVIGLPADSVLANLRFSCNDPPGQNSVKIRTMELPVVSIPRSLYVAIR